MRLCTYLAVGATAALALLPTAAEARTGPPLQPFPHSVTTPEDPTSDGARYFALNAAPGTVRVFDTETRSVRDVAVGERCRARSGSPGVVLVVCDQERTPYLLRLATGALHPVPVGPQTTEGIEYWHTVGRHWIAGTTTTVGKQIEVFVNRRTGERVSRSFDLDAGRDVDDPKLRPYPRSVFDRDGSLSLRAGDSADGSLSLLRRGPDTRLTTRPWRSTQLSAGIVTWTEEPRTVRAYDDRARVRLGWVVDGPATVATSVHTRKHVLVAARSSWGESPRLLWARIRK
ncbi:MAG TPA: hypothetical protein VF715_14260 [Thermoleophilaceae bacterium]